MSKDHQNTPRQKMAQAWRRIADISDVNRPDAKKYLEVKRAQGIKANTIALYALALRHFDASLQGKHWKDVEPDDATLFLSRLRLQKKTHETIQTMATCCKAFLKWELDTPQLPQRLLFTFRVLGNQQQLVVDPLQVNIPLSCFVPTRWNPRTYSGSAW